MLKIPMKILLRKLIFRSKILYINKNMFNINLVKK